MGIIREECQITGLRLTYGNVGTVAVLRGCTAALADDVAHGVVEHPIRETGAIHAVGAISPGGGAAVRPDLLKLPPAAVPADGVAFYSDR